jgi:hypothetical protein
MFERSYKANNKNVNEQLTLNNRDVPVVGKEITVLNKTYMFLRKSIWGIISNCRSHLIRQDLDQVPSQYTTITDEYPKKILDSIVHSNKLVQLK